MKALTTTLLLWLCCLGTYAQTVFINEIHYDNSGTDADEAIELAGPAGTTLNNWQLVLYNGSNGDPYNTISITHTFTNDHNGFGFYVETLAVNGLQNGAPDGIALIDENGTVVQFLSYEGSFTAESGAASGSTSTDIGVSESSSTLSGYSLQLSGSGTSYDDFTWASEASNTFGSVNNDQTFSGTPSIQTPVINEFVFNHTGTDSVEYVEIYGSSDTDYSAYTLLEIEGDATAPGSIDGVFAIDTTDENGYWMTGYLRNAFENGSVSLLLVKDFTGTSGEDIDSTNDGTLDYLPWAEIVDAIAVSDGDTADLFYSDVILTPDFDGLASTPGGASRIPNGTDNDVIADWTRNDFDGEGLPGFSSGTIATGEAYNTPLSENILYEDNTYILINEIDVDNTSTDDAEFIELFDGGTGNTSLSGLVLVLYNGNNDASYNAIGLDGYTTNESGYFVIGSSAVANVDLIAFTTNGIQNGADAVALYAGSEEDFPTGTAITTENLIDAIVYDTDDDDDEALLVLLADGAPQVNENENGNKDEESLQRIPNGDGGLRNTSAFQADTPTPGADNDAEVNIPDIISIAAARAEADDTYVTVTGTLTVSDQFAGSAYIQDSTGGIAVYDSELYGDGLFEIGDSVTITGIRSSYYNQLQISELIQVIDYGPSEEIAPTAISSSELSSYAGQLISISNIDFELQNELIFGNNNYTASDANGDFEIRFDADVEALIGKATPTETCAKMTGVVARYQDIYQVLPRQVSDASCLPDYTDPADDYPLSADETLDVVAWNIEWFGDESNAPAADDVQKDSVKAILLDMEADIIAVEEITDTVLFEQMIDEMSGYDYILSDKVSYPDDDDASQRVGFIYNTNTVQPISFKGLLASIHPYYNGGDASYLTDYPADESRFYASGRLPFMMEAGLSINGQQDTMLFIVLHARANSSSDAELRYEMRKYDVEVLKDTLDAQYGNEPFVLLGDFNDDLDETVADVSVTTSSYAAYTADTVGYSFPTLLLSEEGKRSYVFSENMIDHIVLSNELSDNYLDGTVSVGYTYYDADYAYTTSDHLPVKVRLGLSNNSQANEVVSFQQGKRLCGKAVHSFRSNSEKAIGLPYENWWYNFVSLGFGGSITLKMNAPIFDQTGDDIQVVESTAGFIELPCDYYPEQAEVYASTDGNDFVLLGETCQDGTFDLADAHLSSAKYIRITDISDPNDFWHLNADGYDLDAVVSFSESTSQARTDNSLSDQPNYAPNEEPLLEVIDTPYPNPATTQFNFSIALENETELNATMYNTSGQKVWDTQYQLEVGIHQLSVPVEQLNKGIYILQLKSDGSVLQEQYRIAVL